MEENKEKKEKKYSGFRQALSKRKKIFVLAGMVALLIVTGVLNIVLNNTEAPPVVGGGGDTRTLFQTYRIDRQATREQTLLALEAIIAAESTSAAARQQAEEQRLAITQNMEVELILEGLIKAVGFEDAFITMSTENVNVIVKAESLTEDEATRIFGIIVDETKRSPQNVIIIPLSTR